MITAAQISKVMHLTGDLSAPLGVQYSGMAMEDDGRLTADVPDLDIPPDQFALLESRNAGDLPRIAKLIPCGVMLTAEDFTL